MTTAQNQALGRAEAHASKEHTIVIDYFEPFETLLKDWWAERGGGA
ncbi:hypothetical protein [Ralstonia phage RPZH6]|nr:hypothetical protein [Ralstonia phage RPZH6]